MIPTEPKLIAQESYDAYTEAKEYEVFNYGKWGLYRIIQRSARNSWRKTEYVVRPTRKPSFTGRLCSSLEEAKRVFYTKTKFIMTQEKIEKVIANHQELDWLDTVKKEIANTKEHRLCYIHKTHGMTCDNWEIDNMSVIRYIGDILDRHDLQIRKEIDEEIEKLQKELQEL